MPTRPLPTFTHEFDEFELDHGVPFDAPEEEPVEDDEGKSPPAPPRLRIDSRKRAEWAGRVIAQILTEREEVTEHAKEWIAQIAEWRDGELARTEKRLKLLTYLLEVYASERREATGDATLKLPSVTVKTVRVGTKVVIEDEAQVAAWVKTMFDPDLYPDDPDAAAHAAEVRAEVLKVTEEVLVSKLREHVRPVGVDTGRHVLTLRCGCTVIDPDAVGDEASYECGSHGVSAVVKRGMEQVLAAQYGNGPVPGCSVVEEHVRATVVPVR